MIISKDIKFDCAHMLSNYEGKCANLHGHTYHGTVTIEGDIAVNVGMVLDYNKIKEVVDKYDHAIIFSSAEFRGEAEDDLVGWATKYAMRYVVLPFGKSTAEVLALTIAEEFDRYGKVTVRLSETDGSWAEAEAHA